MDVGFDLRRLAINHVFFALWTAFFLPTGGPQALLSGDVGVSVGAILALWVIAGVGLLAIDGLVAYRYLTGASSSDSE